MTAQKKGLEIKSRGLFLFGILLLLVGLAAASFYNQSIGIVLVLVGILFIVLGFIYPLSGARETRQRQLSVIPKTSE